MTGGPLQPAVSVIVPAYNTGHFIAESIQSVIDQTFQDFEIIVVNDASPDSEVIEQQLAPYKDRIRYLKKGHSGLAGTRNFGIREARGRYLAMLDSDDIWTPDYLSTLVGLLESNPLLDIVFPNAVLFGDPATEGQLYMDLYPFEGEPDLCSVVLRKCAIFGLVTGRREAIVRAGLYDESLKSCEDFDLWLRCFKTGARFGYSRKVLVRYRRRPGTLSTDHFALARDTMYGLQKIKNYDLTPREMEVVLGEIEHTQARMDLLRGKSALVEGRIREALQYLENANRYFRKPRTRLAIAVLRYAPALVRMTYAIRERYFQFRSTRRW